MHPCNWQSDQEKNIASIPETPLISLSIHPSPTKYNHYPEI